MIETKKTTIIDRIKIFLTDTLLLFYLSLLGFYFYDRLYIVLGKNVDEDTYQWLLGRIASSGLGWVFLACVIISIIWELSGFSPGQKMMKAGRFTKLPEQILPWHKSFYTWLVLIVLLLTLLTGWLITDVKLIKLIDARKLKHIGRIFNELLEFTRFWQKPQPRSWSIFNLVLLKILETIYLALMATIFAIPVAFLISFFGAKNLMKDSKRGITTYYIVRGFLNIIRSIEPICWAIIFSAWVGFGAFAGVLALAVHSVAALGKLYSEQIESIDPGPIEAIRSTGANSIQVIRYAVIPQIIPPFLSFTMYRWDINLRMATILGFVGGGGIGYLLSQYCNQVQYPEVGIILFVITIIVWIMDTTSAKFREKLI